MLRALAALLVPPRCGACARPTEAGRRLCVTCERDLRVVQPLRFRLGELEVVSAAPYAGVVRRLVAGLKFSGRTGLAEPAAAAMAAAWGESQGEASGEPRDAVLVPAPAVGLRTRMRGFDPAALLARELARATGAELVTCLRRADCARQVGRGRAERLREGPRVLASAAAARLAGRRVWLVDDVVTTGATLAACESALRDVGVRCAGALTLARSL